MLTVRKAPRACQSCRLQLLSLFEHGFAGPATSNTTRLRYTTRARLQPRTLQSPTASARRFTTSRSQLEEQKKSTKEDGVAEAEEWSQDLSEGDASAVKVEQDLTDEAIEIEEELVEHLPEENIPVEDEIESVVRQARQTFGNTLPKNYLSAEEYTLYERLYGPPLRETRPEDLEFLPNEEELEEVSSPVRNVILRENAHGEYEEIEFDPELGFEVIDEEFDGPGVSSEANEELADLDQNDFVLEDGLVGSIEESPAESKDDILFQGKNQREIDAISRLKQEMEEALTLQTGLDQEQEEVVQEQDADEYIEEEEYVEEEEEDFDDGPTSDEIRTHPHTMAGRSGPYPRTLTLPKDEFTDPVSELLDRTSTKHLMDAAEKAFGGKGLPYSAATPYSKRLLPQKEIGLDASQHRMTEIEADSYLAAVMPGTYATVMTSLVEIRKRLGRDWVREMLLRDGGEGPRVLDAGAGGAGVVAWREILNAEWDIMKEEGFVKGDAPLGKSTVLTGSNTLRHRVSRFLENTTFVPRLPDYVHASESEKLLDSHSAQPKKSFDIIIAPNTLFPLKEDFRRKNMVDNLWSLLDPKGGVLLLTEKGIPRGFEAIAGARQLLLDSHISSPGQTTIENQLQSSTKERFTKKEDGMIIAPCTNHSKCPMYPVHGLSSGRKDFCHFAQRYIRPTYLQRVLGASMRNHEDVKYSYVAVRRGIDARKTGEPILTGEKATDQSFEGYEDYDLPGSSEHRGASNDIKFNALALPRSILPPLKRRGHVTLDLCTPSGKLERWTVPKSFSRGAYRDARKTKWGDLWALGAKTRVPRTPRLGRLGQEEGKKKKGIRDGKDNKTGKKMKKNQFDIIMGPGGMQEIREPLSQTKFVKRNEKRTKGGRIYKPPKPITEDDL